MPVAPTYPGVYLQELRSGDRTITGVATSIGAFVDWFPRGPVNQAVQVFSWADVERTFGGLHDRSEASYALQQFFLNGGTTAWVVRVGNGATATIEAVTTGLANAIRVSAANPGAWGNQLRVRVTPSGSAGFHLAVRQYRVVGEREVVEREERYLNLTTAFPPASGFEPVDAVTGASELFRTTVLTVGNLPAATGTLGAALTPTALTAGPLSLNTNKSMQVALDPTGTGPIAETRTVALGTSAVASIDDLAARLEGALRSSLPGVGGASPVAGRVEFADATVRVVGDRLQVTAGCGTSGNPTLTFADDPADAGVASAMGLVAGANVNVASYQVGSTAPVAQQGAGTAGTDGNLPTAGELIGSSVTPRSGLYALEDADTFNLLCLPRIAKISGSAQVADNFAENQVIPVVAAATAYCEQRRAMFLVDPPSNVDTLPQIRTWITANATIRHKNLALHYPRIQIADPNNGYRLRSLGASGTVAGLCAKTDTDSGVWTAPAGTDAVLRGTSGLARRLTDAENGQLNPIAVNCLRTFDLYGNVNWGARTLVGEDARGDEWKYLNVRRFALFLEETLFRSTQWVIFENNDEPLWSQIRTSVGAFMADLFRKGAFQGATKSEAYFVRCDANTTSPLDQSRGIVNLVVGFAPLKPAEFLVISIQQIPQKVEV